MLVFPLSDLGISQDQFEQVEFEFHKSLPVDDPLTLKEHFEVVTWAKFEVEVTDVVDGSICRNSTVNPETLVNSGQMTTKNDVQEAVHYFSDHVVPLSKLKVEHPLNEGIGAAYGCTVSANADTPANRACLPGRSHTMP